MEWKVTLGDLCYDESERQAVGDVLRSGWLSMGARVAAFERALSKRLGGAHAIMVNSGTAALHLALVGLGVGRGAEVVVPAMTFVATANVARQCGARVLVADIVAPEEPTIDPEHCASLVTERTRAVMPVHYAGFSCRMLELFQIALEHERLSLVEDAAHALGGEGGNAQPLGAMGDAGAFSFFSNKNLAVGEGGAVVTHDPELADRLTRLRSHGMTSTSYARHHRGSSNYDVREPGFNYRPTEISAALGLAQNDKFDDMQARRAALYDMYCERLDPVEAVTIPFRGRPVEGRPAYHIFPVLLPDTETRDRAGDNLRAADVQTSHHYQPLHHLTAYRNAMTVLPRAEDYARRELTLPFHPRMSDADVDYVTEALIRAL